MRTITARQEMLFEKKLEQGRKNAKHLKRIALCTFLLDYYALGIQSALEEVGLYRQEVKHKINQILERTGQLQGIYRQRLNWATKLLHTEPSIRVFDELNEETIKNINENLFIEGLERDYSITMAICRIIQNEVEILRQNRLEDFADVNSKINVIYKRLMELPITDKQIDCIIEKNLCL